MSLPPSDRLKDLLEISASLAAHNSGVRVHEMTEVSVEFVGGRISDSSCSSRQPPWLSSFKAVTLGMDCNQVVGIHS
jgi:hypothetical protein